MLLADPDNDAVLVLNVETALASATGAAVAVAGLAGAESGRHVMPKPVLAAWIGTGDRVAATFTEARIPHYDTETEAVRGFMHLVRYREAMAALMETPPSLPADFSPAADEARGVVAGVIAAGRTWLDPLEVNRICAAYGIPATPAAFAATPGEAAVKAGPWLAEGQAVAVKILSHDIVHKSDVGGVRLGLIDAAAVEAAAAEVIASARAKRPDAHIAGVTVQPMIVRPKARELLVGIADDATFGPVIVFGHGGVGVEVIDDKAVALPPLDLALARDLIGRTRVARLLAAYRNVPAARPTRSRSSSSGWRSSPPTCPSSASSTSIRCLPTRSECSPSTCGSPSPRPRRSSRGAAIPALRCGHTRASGSGTWCSAMTGGSSSARSARRTRRWSAISSPM